MSSAYFGNLFETEPESERQERIQKKRRMQETTRRNRVKRASKERSVKSGTKRKGKPLFREIEFEDNTHLNGDGTYTYQNQTQAVPQLIFNESNSLQREVDTVDDHPPPYEGTSGASVFDTAINNFIASTSKKKTTKKTTKTTRGQKIRAQAKAKGIKLSTKTTKTNQQGKPVYKKKNLKQLISALNRKTGKKLSLSKVSTMPRKRTNKKTAGGVSLAWKSFLRSGGTKSLMKDRRTKSRVVRKRKSYRPRTNDYRGIDNRGAGTKSLKTQCKRVGIRVTTKRNGKYKPKRISTLISQLKRKI